MLHLRREQPWQPDVQHLRDPRFKSCLRCKQSLANCRLVDKIRDAAHIAELTAAARSSSMRAYRAKLSQPQVGAIHLPRKQRATRAQAASRCHRRRL